jgi:nucleoside-diphosphate-sugar epimerase
MNIAILGAPGCVGRAVIRNLLDSEQYGITASYRTEEEIPKGLHNGRLRWRHVDLLNQSSAENFLQGAETLIYLIHSLGAKNFEQLDIKLANAAGNAAVKAGIKKIIYLGGIIPKGGYISPHLISRMKTGEALASYEMPVGEVRASILLATCSMSYRVVYFLSKRLPVMITPRWLNSLCAPIAIEDAVSVIGTLVSRDVGGHEIFEIGSDVVRYRELLSLCGESIRGVGNLIIPVPLFAPHLSALWIELVTGVPNSVGIALAEGLRSDTIPSRNRFREATGRDPITLKSVLSKLAEEMMKERGMTQNK